MDMRNMFLLPEEETEYLNGLYEFWETIKERQNWLLIHNYPIPTGYTVNSAILAINIPLNYPFSKLDMAYFYPALTRKDGKAIPATQCTVNIDGKNYQRWSRHYSTWDAESDSLITHLMAVNEWLLREFKLRS